MKTKLIVTSVVSIITGIVLAQLIYTKEFQYFTQYDQDKEARIQIYTNLLNQLGYAVEFDNYQVSVKQITPQKP